MSTELSGDVIGASLSGVVIGSNGVAGPARSSTWVLPDSKEVVEPEPADLGVANVSFATASFSDAAASGVAASGGPSATGASDGAFVGKGLAGLL